MNIRPSVVLGCVLLLATVLIIVGKFPKTANPVCIAEDISIETHAPVARDDSALSAESDGDFLPMPSATPSDLSGPTKEELQQLLSMEPTEESLRKLKELIEGMNEEDLPKYLDVFNEAPPGSALFQGLSVYLKKWAETDPKAALDYVFKSPDGTATKLDAAAEAVRIFASKNFAGALVYLQNVETPEQRKILMNHLAPVLVAENAAQTREWIKSIPDGEAKEAATFLALRKLTELSVESAVDWAFSMANEPFVQPMMAGVCLMIAERDPSRGVEFFKYIPEGPGKDEIVQGLFSRWQMKNPETLAEYYSTMPPGRDKEMAAKGVSDMKAGLGDGQ